MIRIRPGALIVAGSLLLAWTACDGDDGAVGDGGGVAEARRAQEPVPAFEPVTAERLARTGAASGEWLTYGGSYGNHRYSALDQITPENVRALVPVWVYQTGVAESFETTPLVAGNVLYLTTAEGRVVALNAATGSRLWEYIPELGSTLLCCGPNNRGVAILDDRVFVGTLDARLIALDRRTGSPAWEAEVADPEDGHSITMAPLAYDGKVVVGVSGGKYGIRGFVAAYDARTGEEAWRWHTIPAPDEAPNGWYGDWKETDPFGLPLDRDIAAEKDNLERYRDGWRRGGGAVWMTPAYDPATRTLYLSVGGPAPPLDGAVRPGDNLYTGSVVALDGRTGELRWHFQYLPHDRWDLSGASPPFLFEAGGRRYVGYASKLGWVYVLDAATGRPVLRSDNFVPQQNLYTAPTEEGVRIAPGADGGTGWSPVAYSPRTGLAYVLGMHRPMTFARAYQPREEGRLWLGGSFTRLPDQEEYGTFSAIDVRTGEIRWQHRVPAPMAGAALATAGGVVFVGQGTGTLDAFDAEAGTLLWQFRAGAGVHGGPVTYMVDGVQYVAVAAGGNYHLDTPRGDDLYVFALGDRRPALPLSRYGRAEYRRGDPLRYGEARQVPATAVR